eukprot:4814328-Pleurochrysis_carterae.AAC.1
MRTEEIDACESSVDLQTLSQRLAAFVADANAPCMQTARSTIVHSFCRGASTDGQAHDQHIGCWMWTYKQQNVHERLMLALSKRLVALVADAAAIYMHTARLATVYSLFVWRRKPRRPSARSTHQRVAMQAAVRTREINACESSVDLQNRSQRLAALVADAVAHCMHTARLVIVQRWLLKMRKRRRPSV